MGGYCPDASESCLPSYPWNTTSNFGLYAGGGALVDTTCGQMARYMGRLVSHYTNGGHTDECGHWHESGFHYNWWGLSVLNEDEHHIKPDNGMVRGETERKEEGRKGKGRGRCVCVCVGGGDGGRRSRGSNGKQFYYYDLALFF